MPPVQDSQRNDLEKVFLTNYDRLNPAQKEAVDAIEGPVMVIAGPGTGKTQILAMRIANILRNPDLQVSPSNILCLTFTESATAAMRKRLISIIGSEAYYVRIHTFHSFCNEIIKDHPHKFLSISPISELEQIQIINEIIDSLDANSPIKPFGDPYIYRQDLISNIQTLKRESIDAEKLEESISRLESFIETNRSEIEDFIAVNARYIKDEDINLFLEKINIKNPGSMFARLFQEFCDHSEKPKDFKQKIKDFYEKGERDVPKQRELVNVYRAYQERLIKLRLYDFNDMILRVINQFKQDEELLAKYQEQYQYILVDEYQDTNGAQNELLRLLISYYQENPNIFVVGDDDQSIFRFQGASLENIIHFYRLFQNHTRLVVLKHNYRSHQAILDLASFSIDFNQSRITKLIRDISKDIKSASEEEHKDVEIIKAHKLSDEIFVMGKKIQSLIAAGVEPSEIAVLFRENRSARDILDTFSRMNIPCSIEIGDNVLEDHYIARLIDLLKVISSPDTNSDLLFNVLNYDFVLQSPDFINARIDVQDVFLVNAKRRDANRGEDKQSFIQVLLADDKFSAWAKKILDYNQKSYNLRLDDLLERVVNEFGYLKYIFGQQDYLLHVSNLDSLFTEARSLIDSPGLITKTQSSMDRQIRLKNLIEHLQLLQDNNLKIKAQILSSQANSVRLMTAHKSKGLEFEHVFLHACVDKRWGNKASRSKLKLPVGLLDDTEALVTDDSNEDERRIFYVALTRAKCGLYLCYHSSNEKDQDLVPSIFISELEKHPSVVILDYSKGSERAAGESFEEEKLRVLFSPKSEQVLLPSKEFIETLLENYKMSVTHLNNYLECPRKFLYQNLVRVPAAKNKHASFGTAVHLALYDLFMVFKSKSPATPAEHERAIAFLLEKFEEYLDKERLPEIEHDDSLSFGKKILRSYYDKYSKSFNTNTLLEYNFEPMGINLEGIQITGKLDKIEIVDEPARLVNVVDYKTGNPASKSKSMKPGGDYYRQIAFYQLLCDLARDSGQFKYKMLSGEIDFVQPNQDEFVKRSINISTEDLGILKSEIRSTYDAIKAQDFHMTEDLNTCYNCNFKNICGR